ncbi:hypothetical protein [Chamaesiphon sp. VAR_48_metabat_403]|uniref:hypothetical protein n=1 Tax=Chamaesiphon sp. VAR_48_metabat_403 TaxID=2964700 RepID=UPI00286D8187|nr:hypothetical protein [Chamaesiphon sp. VAR_48_metabat_403]
MNLWICRGWFAARVSPVGEAVPTVVCAYGRLRQRQRQRQVSRRFSGVFLSRGTP